MKIYVATAFPNLDEACEVMQALRDAGHEISHDWTKECLDPEWPPDQQEAYLQQCGAADFAGVVVADALVLINHDKCRDAMTEFGIALGWRRPVFVLYPERRTSVFFHRARAHSSSVAELLVQLEDALSC